MKFYKIRAILFVIIIRILAKILFVEIPPIPSAAGIIVRNGKVLLLKLSYYKGYGLPGGILSGEETAEEGVKREIREETGLTVTNSKYLFSIAITQRKIKSVCLFYEAETEGDLKESREGTLHWVDPKDAINNMAYENANLALKRYFNL